jgi:hypothetical protein
VLSLVLRWRHVNAAAFWRPATKDDHRLRARQAPDFPQAYTHLVRADRDCCADMGDPVSECHSPHRSLLARRRARGGHRTDANPQGFFNVILAPIAGSMTPPALYHNAIDVALFVPLIPVDLSVCGPGRRDAGIKRAMTRLRGREGG